MNLPAHKIIKRDENVASSRTRKTYVLISSMLAIPIIILYELSIIGARMIERKRETTNEDVFSNEEENRVQERTN